jgi:N-acetylglucosamine-6-phosphate deacetylase
MQDSAYIDLHVNGHAGVDFLSAKTPDEIRKATRSLKSFGVAGFLPSLITSDLSNLKRSASLINEVTKSQGDDEARILGIHLEGPCLASERRGVHSENLLRQPEPSLISELLSIPNVKMITLAPELPGGIEATKTISEAGVVVSLGHTTANRKVAEAAFDAGAKTVTHLYNGMEKDGELVELVLERDDIYFQMIIDDVHVPRELVRKTCDVALDRLIITTDALAAAGLGPGRYPFGDMEIEIKDGKALRLDGRLAGGIGTPALALEILADLGYSRESALTAATSRPLELINAKLK